MAVQNNFNSAGTITDPIVTERFQERSYTHENGQYNAVRSFIVQLPDGGVPLDAIKATGIPDIGDLYPDVTQSTATSSTGVQIQAGTVGATGITNVALTSVQRYRLWLKNALRCTTVSAAPLDSENTPYIFLVTCEYSTKGSASSPTNESDSDGSDTGLPPTQISVTTSHVTRVLEFDADDNTMPVRNSAGVFFDPPVEYDGIDYTITITVSKTDIEPAPVLEYAGTVNNADLKICGISIPKYRGRISNIDWRIEWQPGNVDSNGDKTSPEPYSAITYTIEVCNALLPQDAKCSLYTGPAAQNVLNGRKASEVGPWGAIVLDRGTKYLAPTATGATTYQLVDIPPNETQIPKLNGYGGLLHPPSATGYAPAQLQDAWYKCYRRYPVKDWSPLNLPTAMFSPKMRRSDYARIRGQTGVPPFGSATKLGGAQSSGGSTGA